LPAQCNPLFGFGTLSTETAPVALLYEETALFVYAVFWV
jgi:hypothetical protein